MAGFAPIQGVDVGGLIGAYESAKDRRVRQMLLERQIAAEDRAIKRQEGIAGAYAKLRPPTAKGGDQTSAGSGAATTPPAAAPAPSIASAYPTDIPHGSPLSPERDPVAPPVSAPAPAPPASSFSAEPPQSWVEANRDVVAQLKALDPKEALAMQAYLKEMDDAQLKKAQESSTELAKAAKHLTSFQSVEARRAELQRIKPYLISHGVAPDQIDSFDPTDQNLQFIYMQGLDLDKLATIEHQDRQFAETQRHNRATEENAAGGLAVRQGALGLAREREGRVAAKKGSDVSGSDRDALINSLIAN